MRSRTPPVACLTRRDWVGIGVESIAAMTTTDQRPLAVVTGAPAGIGYELAKQFADQ